MDVRDCIGPSVVDKQKTFTLRPFTVAHGPLFRECDLPVTSLLTPNFDPGYATASTLTNKFDACETTRNPFFICNWSYSLYLEVHMKYPSMQYTVAFGDLIRGAWKLTILHRW